MLLLDFCDRSANFDVWHQWLEICREFSHFAFTHKSGFGFALKPGTARLPELYSELVSSDPDKQVRLGRTCGTIPGEKSWSS